MQPKWMRIDLNLLKSFYVLLEERDIAKAADRRFLTRSAMSKSLRRLREALDDPILVRTQTGELVPTPRAELLAESMHKAIFHIEGGLDSGASFDLSQCSDRLRVAIPEPLAFGAVPNLFSSLHESAPGLHLEALNLEKDYLQQMSDGNLDLAINFDLDYGPDFVSHSIFQSVPVLWCRQDHPLAATRKVTTTQICEYPKLVFHLPEVMQQELENVLDKIDQAEQSREVMFETSHLMLAFHTLRRSDALMVGAEYLFTDRSFANELKAIPLTHLEWFRNLTASYAVIQHVRTTQSPLHQWAINEVKHQFELLAQRDRPI